MVRALLDGRKTQTRRLFKPEPYLVGATWWVKDRYSGYCHLDDVVNDRAGCMKYQVGDRLYVRENGNWKLGTEVAPNAGEQRGFVWYAADGEPSGLDFFGGKMRPCIHMPRWASRLTLTVEAVKVERLQEIGFWDACAEGIQIHWSQRQAAAIDAYRDLWNSLHGAGSWDANPWVVALTFSVIKGNIDGL